MSCAGKSREATKGHGEVSSARRDFDAVVIGSGSGGRTAALALARAGRRVAVFEQHTIPGGYSQSFEQEGFQVLL